MHSSLYVKNLPAIPDSSYWYHLIKSEAYPVALQSLPGENSQENYFEIISAAPEKIIRVVGNNTIVHSLSNRADRKIYDSKMMFDQLKEMLPSPPETDQASSVIPFQGGWIGYWGYELNEVLHEKHIRPRENSDPKMIAGLYLWSVIIDHGQKNVLFAAHPDLDKNRRSQIEQILLNTGKKSRDKSSVPFSLLSPFRNDTDKDDYVRSFNAIQKYLLSGDCYQVNLTQRFSAPFRGCFWEAHRRMNAASPTLFTSYLDFGEIKISSHSPERFILADQCDVETSPIKGTCARGTNQAEDEMLAEKLSHSEKDRSENLMIVDLLRNDFGKVCTPGSVKVPHLFRLESFANVHHLVSYITGKLPDSRMQISLFQQSFPGGSITGAPKLRSMQIIRELEDYARSVYCGSIGYISCHGRMDTSIAIRTVVAKNSKLYCWAGGAIVADSEVESEYEESLTKVKNLIQSLEANGEPITGNYESCSRQVDSVPLV